MASFEMWWQRMWLLVGEPVVADELEQCRGGRHGRRACSRTQRAKSIVQGTTLKGSQNNLNVVKMVARKVRMCRT